MRRALAALALGLALLGPAAPARAQDLASLVADRLVIERGALLAEGEVEVLYRGTRLTARALRYDRARAVLAIEGPIRIEEAGGRAVFVADAAALDPDLAEGILTGARVVLDRQLQIAAAEIARAGGVSRLTRAVASSCRVCAASPVPLWEIRSARVTLDEARERLTFERAQLRVSGVPVLYLPRLRLPAPGNERAAGFLVPRLRTTSRLGTGVVAPYFVPLGRSADVTLSPYLSGRTRTLEGRYRQAFRAGTAEITGALTLDDLSEDLRGYAFARGAFALPRGFRLDFDLRRASDGAYLLDYGLSDEDRLPSVATVSRARPAAYAEARVLTFQDLRGREAMSPSPRVLAAFEWDRRYAPEGLGTLDLRLSGDAYRREGPLGETDLDRDAVRLGAQALWRGARVLPGGVLAGAQAGLDAQTFEITEGARAPDRVTRAVPVVGAELRWPWRRAAPSGAIDVIEPAVLAAWSPDWRGSPPREEAARPELDEGNLLALSRLPGEGRVERGGRVGAGVAWRRFAPGGGEAGLTLGRVLRARADDRFGPGTGLDGRASDWLLAADLDTGAGLSLMGRALVDDDLTATLGETVIAFEGAGLRWEAGYVWLAAAPASDPVEARPRTSQVTLDADLALTRRWSGSAALRYDLRDERPRSAGLGLVWRNECAEVDLSVSRRFEDSSSLAAETRFGLSVAFLGFGARAAEPGRSACDPQFR